MANGMDSPKREPYLPGCDLQGSPLFKFLCSLSPIKQAKAAHVAQTYSELSFPAPLPVFVSPPAKVKREVVEERPESSVTVDVSGKQTMVQNDAEMTDKLAVSSETTEERTLETVEDRCLPTAQNHRGPRRRCLDFQESQSSSIENPVASSIPASMFCEEACEDVEEEMYQEQQEDTPTTSTSCSDSFAAENLMALAQLSSDPACGLSSESSKQKQVLPDSIPTGIGLHLNALTSGLGMLTGQRGIYNLPGAALNLGPGLLLSVVEKTRMDQQEFRGSAEEGFKSSTTCVRSLTLGIQALEEGVSFGVDKVITPGRKRLSLSDSLEGEPTRTPKKKRKSLGKDAGDGCKRCHCKKSKCLKLYCECFAAGVYCLDSCACRDCFNKPEFSETVLGTRQQIETRNPLAFAPKIVQTAESTPAEGVPCPETSSSARHKRGCNCKKSLCLKKYCECYQAGVGCSDGCRCNGCKNLYGIKKVQDEADQLEDQTMSVTSISPITPTFQQAPPLDILPLESSSCDLSKIYESAGLMGCELTQTPSSPPAASMVEGMETPEFLRDERCSPRTVIQGSPNKKRVVPPNTGPPSSVLKSGRKLTLQTLPSLPPVTPFSFAQQQGYKRSSYNT